MHQETVFVGLSGGVDSSVAALRLKKQGFNVVGVFIKVWHPDFLECNWEAERLDAMRVAAHLEIPFLTCDAEAAYKESVGDYFISEYKAGRTPNPDVLCNQHVKFGAFLEFAKQHGADFVATGHYAQKIKTEDETFELHRGVDENKDQSYFLWTLTQDQLKHILFPVGDTPKTAIRKEAEAAKIPVATKKDSQGICFLGHVDIKEFMSHFVDLVPGPVKLETGEIIGTHGGALIYTLGQRHGFTVNNKDDERAAYYVLRTDLETNTVIVSIHRPRTEKSAEISLEKVNLISEPEDGPLSAQFRYRQKPFLVTFSQNTISVDDSVETPADGQSCVLYQGKKCLGGGIIAK